MSSFQKIQGAQTNAQHTYSDEEADAFSSYISNLLSHDPLLKRHLPLEQSNDIFIKISDGLILCQLINFAVPDTIDYRAINKHETLNIYQKTENLNLALSSAKSIGVQIVNIGAQDIIEGNPILILGLIWQIIRIQLLSSISLTEHPELVVLLQDGEELNTFIKLPPETILLRWVNYHLNAANSTRNINNFGSDVSDSEIYSILLHQLSPGTCKLVTDTEPLKRANQVIKNATSLSVEPFIKPQDICDGNKKLNLSFVAQLFNTCPGLTVTEDVRASIDLSTLEIDDVGDSREERVFRMWLNSLNLDNIYINNLFANLQDGVVFLKLLDYLKPGIVVPKKFTVEPKSRFKQVENANYVVALGKELKLSMVNVGGLDIVDGNKKLILSIVSQLQRMYTLQVLQGLASHQGVNEVSEDRIVAWANEKVTTAGKTRRIKHFKDSTIKNSLFLLDLVAAVEPRAVDHQLISAGTSEVDYMNNAKYVISCARKANATVFLTPEDIVEVKSKMLLTFVSAIWAADLTRK